MRVGTLSMQGDVREHLAALAAAGAEPVEVKRPEQLADLAGLVIPGGESTAIGKLMVRWGFMTAVAQAVGRGLGVYGTCAGLILLADDIVGSDQPRLGLLPMTVHRNAYGRQRESFEADLAIPALGEAPFRAVFIRAPYIESVRPPVEVLAEHDGHIIMARLGRHLVSSFHPELTGDSRVHRLFLAGLA